MKERPSLKNKSFLSLKDFNKEEISSLLELSLELKQKKKTGGHPKYLDGKSLALLFEKTSTRTRCAFSVAATDLGMNADYLGKDDIQMGKKESVADTARVLGRMYDCIEYRGFSHHIIEELAQYANVPVYNGLTDEYHPTQILADFLTIQEQFNRLEGIKFTYTGDGRNNMANSLMIGSAIMGLDFRILAPESLTPSPEIVQLAQDLATRSGAKITITQDFDLALKDADVIYTDVWVSMGEEDKFKERIELLMPYQVNQKMIDQAQNSNLIFLHCLPAFHDRKTKIGEEIFNQYGISEMEVTNEVFEGSHSKVFDQAENRLHTIKAVMLATLS